MGTEKVRIGVIGVGQIGKKHLENYRKLAGAEVVALADIDAAELSRVAAANNVADTYTDFRKLLARHDLQAVDVCLHNNLHAPVTIEALHAGKHVYCEKPMAGSWRDAEAMLAASRQTGKKLSIQVKNLFARETVAAKALIAEGRLGRLYHARSTGFRRRGRPFVDGYGSPAFVQKRTSGGGAMYDLGVYHLVTLLYLLGSPEVERVVGKTYQEVALDEARRKESGYDVEELGVGFVRLAGNLSLDIIESWAIHLDGIEGSVIVGSEGGVRLKPFGFFHSAGHLDLNSAANVDDFISRRHGVGGVGDEYDSPQSHWIAALQGRVTLLPTAELALSAMLISEGIYLSEKLGREVDADEIRKSSLSSALKI